MKDHRLRSSCILLNSLSRGHSVRRMGIWCPMAVIQQESIAFPSHGREFQPQAALLHQFPPYLAQRQLRGSRAALAPARQTGWLSVLLPSVLCPCFGFSWIWTKMVSYAALELLFEEHPSLPFPSAVQRERGGGKPQSGWLGCLFSLNFCPVWPYISNKWMKPYYSCVHLRVMLGTGNHR